MARLDGHQRPRQDLTLTRIAETHAPDADYELVKRQFGEDEIVALTILIGLINTWNRLQIAARAVHPIGAVDSVAA